MTTSSDISNMSAADLTAAHIALLVASYGRPSDKVAASPTSTAKSSKLAKVKAAKAVSDDGAVAAPKSDKVVTTIPLPTKGTLSARDYMVAMRQSRDHNDRIRAIAGFVGFNPTQSYSSQELSANLAARRTLNPPKGQPMTSGAAVSLRGYVAGMPDMKAKERANLQGREVYTAEQMVEHINAARTAMTEEERHFHTVQAQVERERLAQIKADLAAL